MSLLLDTQKEMVTAIARSALTEEGTIFSVDAFKGESFLRDVATQIEMLILSVNFISKTTLLRIMDKTEIARRSNTLYGHLEALRLEGLWSSTDNSIYMGTSEVQYAPHDQICEVKGSFSLIQVEGSQQLSCFDMDRIKLLARASGATVVFFGERTLSNTPFDHLIACNERTQLETGRVNHYLLQDLVGSNQFEDVYLKVS
ncbi:MAG: hypothetical protein FI734_07690 [SAR202 cluster bacterium]|nr:hypothetical protein [SAR202 cluster bacterium]|tara:strand:- start:3698 stop:4300 length:603 start_codon:yes stop_codon:yes gene_type:complete